MLTATDHSTPSGVLGISTAFHLAKRGYTKITCIDKHPVPSPESAGNDLNKIIRAEYEERLYAEMAVEAMAAWKDAYWEAVYHETVPMACLPCAAFFKLTSQGPIDDNQR